MKYLFDLVISLLIWAGIKKAPAISAPVVMVKVPAQMPGVLAMPPEPVIDFEASSNLKLELIKTIVEAESTLVKLSEFDKRQMVRSLIREIPRQLAEAIKQEKEEFFICHPHIRYGLTRSSEKDFKSVLPDMCQKMDSLGIPYTITREIIYFNVEKLKKFSSYEKSKSFT